MELKDVRRAITRTKRKHRRQKMLGVLVTVVLLAGLVGAVIYLTGHDRNGRDTLPTTSGPGVRTQHTLLFQVRGPDGAAMSSALLARDSQKKSAAVVLVPNRVVAQVPGSGTQRFGLAVDQPDGPAISRSTMADLLGVRVDASWVLDQAAFTKLVDAVDGIKVDVDVDILGKQGSDTVVVVPKGPGQQLNGARALSVLGYRAPGDDELAALPRFQNVLVGLLAKLPSGSDQLTTLAGKIGKGSEISSTPMVTSVLDGVRGDSASGRSSFQIMPVLAVDTNGEPNYRIESGGVTQMVNSVLAGSRLPGRFDQGNRVLVLNQVGTPGLGQAVRDRIVAADFVFVDARNQKPFDRTKTIIVVFDRTAKTKVRASQLATALGLPQAEVQVSDRAQNIADAIVYLGSDFKP
ncbi:MAG: LCP family protein [Actinomycetota bacterium]|nr:LCP family protein [Actinomycetota bacterium]